MTELTQEQFERFTLCMLWSGLSTQLLIDVMLIALTSEKEEEELWALNSLRTFGEIRRKYKDDPKIQIHPKELADLLNKMTKFYFDNYEMANAK